MVREMSSDDADDALFRAFVNLRYKIPFLPLFLLDSSYSSNIVLEKFTGFPCGFDGNVQHACVKCSFLVLEILDRRR